MRGVTLTIVILLSTYAHAASPLDRARQAAKALELDAASRALDEAAASKGLSRAEALEVYELKGMVFALKGDAARARSAFTALLVLSPDFKLAGRQPPRVTTVFAEAKALARDNGALSISLEASAAPGGAVTFTLVKRGFGLGLVKRLEIALDEDGVARTVNAGADETRVAARGRSVTARVTAFGANDWVLLVSDPVTATAPVEPLPPPAVVVTPEPRPAPLPPQVVVEQAPPPPPRGRPLAIAFGVAGGACLIAGIASGLVSRSSRESLGNAGADGVVMGMTREQAIAIDQRAVTTAYAADGLFIAAGALAAGALLTWLIGSLAR